MIGEGMKMVRGVDLLKVFQHDIRVSHGFGSSRCHQSGGLPGDFSGLPVANSRSAHKAAATPHAAFETSGLRRSGARRSRPRCAA
jgi:hypothetical protein